VLYFLISKRLFIQVFLDYCNLFLLQIFLLQYVSDVILLSIEYFILSQILYLYNFHLQPMMLFHLTFHNTHLYFTNFLKFQIITSLLFQLVIHLSLFNFQKCRKILIQGRDLNQNNHISFIFQ
jgi:hypothetical protein